MEIGYARVSRGDTQDLAPQLRALTDAGCHPIYQEEASGGQADRRELARAIGALTPGDVLVVWKLDRLSRSLRDLLFTLEAITAAGAGFRSLTEPDGPTARRDYRRGRGGPRLSGPARQPVPRVALDRPARIA
jgi:DNA invertase Pin-like site-specific DNA recombinase